MPTRKHLSTKLIREKYIKIHENLVKKVEQVHSIAMTTDLWSNRQMKSYIGNTGHFILDWKIHSIMVACHRFQADILLTTYMTNFRKSSLRLKLETKFQPSLLDNAYNMVNAFSLPGFDTLQQESDQSDSEEDIDNSGDPFFDLEVDFSYS